MADFAGTGATASGLNLLTSAPPIAARRIPTQNCHLMAPNPPAGGWVPMETNAFTIGAPAKIILMTTGTYALFGCGAAPNASNTPNAPTAPTIPAMRDHQSPFAG